MTSTLSNKNIGTEDTTISGVLERLSKRFRFETKTHRYGTQLDADELQLNILEDRGEYTVVYQPDTNDEPLHLNARGFELEAVLRELLAG